MKKLFTLLTFTLLLTSCFGGEDVSVDVPQTENTVQEEVLNIEGSIEDNGDEDVLDVNVDSEEVIESPVREPIPIEKVEIKDAATDNEEYDVRANIENDPESSVVTEETFVVPTATRVEEVLVEDAEEVEISAENDALIDDFLTELLEDIDDGLDVIEENE